MASDLLQYGLPVNRVGPLLPARRMTIEAAELQAVELDSKGEKWGALTIVALLSIIEDLTKV